MRIWSKCICTMHGFWGKLTTNLPLPYEYFSEPKYLFVFCGTLKLIDVCDNRDANTFDYHSFLFAASYWMIKDLFMLQILKGSGPVSFCLNDTILPTLYALLNLEFDLPCCQTWFESHFKFFNHDFVCGIKHLPYQAFRRRFLNFERHNESYQEHFFNDFLDRHHCTKSCDICIERVNYELSCFKACYFDKESDDTKFSPFAHTYEPDNQLFQWFTPPVPYHKCTTSCTLHITQKPVFYCFSYQSMLLYAYYTNVTPTDKALIKKCHAYHNQLFNDILEILKEKLEHIYGFHHLRMVTIFNLSICELKMVKSNLLLVGLNLDIYFKSYPGLIDHKLFFPTISFTNKSRFTKSFFN